ncbi:UDP-glucuronate 4-epimerase [Hansschlegelia beijingensis]|uniref:UDP-glucuronate 4-epimerase n=1 Tax=Hansschlegelia beijingensis TaxID=1133344 RepID=A0A7W6D0I7_9HYPH|nr:NAD-dependent epimerase/dehydratase family protein [Hansschlegelia beijingensis]MBB3974543.1 UDP-glucuronate 4-epimerase [Hansschlegelia beijingensis]
MRVLLTGAAGFIGFHVAAGLAARGHEVTGIDHLGEPHPRLKQARLDALGSSIRFTRGDVTDPERVAGIVREAAPAIVVHLAARAGVRDSLSAPFAYLKANEFGHLCVLEAMRRHAPGARLIYASSSAVYGVRHDGPFREEDRADEPASLYAATKRANELASAAYARLFGLRQIGLRLFTVYGEWGRPDMAVWSFADAVLNGREVTLYDGGAARRDFTDISDVVAAVIAMVERSGFDHHEFPHRIYNVCGGASTSVAELLGMIERACGRRAVVRERPSPPGDTPFTAGDSGRLRADYGITTSPDVAGGVERFVAWLRNSPEAMRSARDE